MPTVSGRVVFDLNRSATIDAGDSGLANIPVVLQDVNTGNRLVILTDSNGAYTFNNVPNGNYRIVEAYGTSGGTPTPGNFLSATIGAVPIGEDPPITSAVNPPAGATNLDSLSPNTLFVTVAGSNLSNENFLDGPVIYTDIGQILDSCVVVSPNNLITVANNGTFGTEPAGSPINTAPATNPYPGVAPGFSYITPAPPAIRPVDGSYTIQNISGNMDINNGVWWRIADHTTGDETGRFQAIGGSNPGAVFFQQTINVTPNTNYIFSAWILNLIRLNGFAEPKLGVEILGQGGNIIYQQTLGNAIPASILAPEWKEIGTALNSQGNSQLTVRFTSEGPSAAGNDYAIDDVEFKEINIPNFTPVKSINKNIADIGETVTYTVALENYCDNDLTNVTFQDTVPNGLSFIPGTVKINGVTNSALNPNSGFSVSNISGLTTTTITFDAVVNSIPTPNPTNNTANMTYRYTPIVGGISDQFNQNTNTVPLLVNHAALTPTKTVNLSIADIGDELTYTISFTNTGSVNAENVVLIDPVPNGTSYVGGSLTSNVATSGNPTSTITLVNPVAPGVTVNISFKVRVNSIPNPNPIPNTGNLTYEYTVDPLNPNVQKNINTNTVLTQVNNATLIPIKTNNKSYANVGDTITYNISFTNTGNVNATNVVISDTIPSGTMYVLGSITGDVPFTGNPTSNIILTNPVVPGQTVNLGFRVLITQIPIPNPITNTANVNYQYVVNPANPTKTSSINTNTVFTQVNTVNISTNKATNLNFATIGQEIIYTVSFTNTGNVNAENINIIDTIPNGTSYVLGSLVVNVPSTGDPRSSISLNNPVLPGETVNLTFKVLVNTIPNPNPIPNKATINYKYSVDPNMPLVSGSKDTNTVTTLVNAAIITPSKSTGSTYADIGDTVTHMISFTNTGNQSAINVNIMDIIPNGTSFVAGSLSVSVPYVGSLSGGIYLTNPVAPGESVLISYKLLVQSIPIPNPFKNTATVNYQYIVDPSVSPVSKSIDTNTTATEVRNASIIPIKSAIPSDIVKVGDEIAYTINFTNTGNVSARNVVIKDPVRNGTSLVAGSLSVNKPYTGDLNNGIILTNPVAPGETISITYKLLVNTIPTPNPIVNKAIVNYNYIVDPTKPAVSKEVDSNEVKVIVDPISIEKICTPKEVTLGDTIDYNFVIKNESDIDVNNIIFFDTLPEGVEFVNGSFIGANSSNVIASELISGVKIGSIGARKSKNLFFKVKVISLPCSLSFNNSASLTYELSLTNGSVISRSVNSNGCLINVKKLSFKQGFMDGVLTLPSNAEDIGTLTSVKVTVKSEEYKIIDSPIGISNENLNLTGKKIMVRTTLEVNVSYTGINGGQTTYNLTYEISLCTFIVVPSVDNYGCLINLSTKIEDIFYSKLNNRSFFYNITYLIESGI